MSGTVNPSPITLHHFTIKLVSLASQRLANRPSLKLQIATEDAKPQELTSIPDESESAIWMAKGDVKISSTTGQLGLSISIEEDGVATELCNATVACIDLIGHVQKRPTDPYEMLLEDATSSTTLLVSCMAAIPPSHDTTTLKHDPSQFSSQTSGGVSQLRLHKPPFPLVRALLFSILFFCLWQGREMLYAQSTGLSYRSFPGPPDPTFKRIELEGLYEKARNMPPEHRARSLYAIGRGYLDLFQDGHSMVILDRAISILDEVVQCSSTTDPRRELYLAELSTALITHFQHTHDLATLNDAVKASQEAVENADEEGPYRAEALNAYALAMMARYQQFGDMQDLQQAILQHQKAVESEAGSEKAINFLNNFEDALKSTILHFQEAVDSTPEDHPDKPVILSNLGDALEARFNRLGRVEDIEAVIRHKQLSVDITPDSHLSKPSRLSSLGNAFWMRFDRLGQVEDIDAAITHTLLAVELTPDDHADKPNMLDNLGRALIARFDRLGNLEDLDTGIRYQQLAVELTPDGHPDKLGRLSNLGNALMMRFDRLGNLEDLETTIRYMESLVEHTPDMHPNKPNVLTQLANALEARFSRLKEFEDINKSISYRRMVVKLIPESHPSRPSHLECLSHSLIIRFQHLNDTKDLDEAITSNQMALDLLPDWHPEKSKALTNLGIALHYRYERLQQVDDLLAAYECSSSVANFISTPPAHRLKEARRWALFSLELGLSPLPAYQVAIDMLPRVAWLGLPIHGQHALLEEVGKVVRDAIGAAIEKEEYELAVDWADAGRSVAWQNFLNLRPPLDELRSAHPAPATRLESISKQLELVLSSRDQAGEQRQESLEGMETKSRSATLLALDWDKTVEEIRAKPGFESSLRKNFSQLAQAAREGPVVVLNVQERGCAALLLIPEENGGVYTTSVPLPNFSFAKSQLLHSVFMEVLTMGRVHDRNNLSGEDRRIYQLKDKNVGGINLEDVLASLWVEVVKPVIEALAYTPRTNDLPRIWWCATGPLAFLPIHAAGIYDAEHEELGHKLSDYVVSSYTPTLSALLNDSTPTSKNVSLLAVAQANPPGASEIPNTEVEVEHIKRIMSEVQFASLMKEEATTERVLEGMEKSTWIHFACHGIQDVEQPMKSGLLLHNGRLTLEKLIEKPLPNADFAFLSAGQTATGDEKISEESVHIAAGMLFSGYKGVIATMGSIEDDIAAQIAEDVYRYMLEDGKPDRKKAAHALHYAAKKLRDSKADLVTWVPFIHIGR